ncbi:selenide, water dikinase SelD [Brevirhabdus sp.]|uniref:selenide, water dikinase SelD n=1 Tax=Brevirhabdus sp. TaxID=2004514 RepID=UPI004058A741
MQNLIPDSRDIVLIGGGHAHALLLRRWGMAPLAGARLTLIDPNPTAPYTGMLPGFVAGHYARDALEIDLVRLARHAGARIVLGAATGIDRAARTVSVAGRPPVGYDLLSIDIGITSDMPTLPGFADFGTAAKPLGAFADRWRRFLASAQRGESAPRVAIIGGGVAGAELALAMDHALRARPDRVITVVDRACGLDHMSARAARALRAALAEAGIALHEHVQVRAVARDGLSLADGSFLPTTLVVGAAGARPYGWLRDTGLDLTGGFVSVDRTLQSCNTPGVFAVGDCAHLSHAPRPKAGVFAVREAPVLYDNLCALLTGGKPRAYHPQKDYLKLISLGRRSALADRAGLALRGPVMWRLKDRIDQRFMRSLKDLPPMPAPPLPARMVDATRQILLHEAPPCGGCGAKLGAGVLGAVLGADFDRVAGARRADVRAAPGDDAAILRHANGAQVISVDHLREFTRDPYLMARIATIHALGDVWAMGAAPQAVLPALVLPPLAPRLQARTLDEMMQGILDALKGTGAQIVGGHSSAGAEMTVGLTVTGLDRGEPKGLAGARPGDALLLCKPLGSGTLLAAEMQRRAGGAWMAQAFETMMQPQTQAAAILRDARAMTDVTGFGLAGHLLNMMRASGTGARVTLSDVPLYEGALSLAQAGVRSSLFGQNRQAVVCDMSHLPDTPRADLLFDPQTAGGLLAAVPGAQADDLLRALVAAGYRAARIGMVTTGPPSLEVAG